MAQPPLDISGTAAPVGIDYWGDNSTANGGKGDPVDGLACFPSVPQTIHIHSHLAVVLNGQLLVVPVNIGRVPRTPTRAGCLYQIHNHDEGGRMHIEGRRRSPPPWVTGSTSGASRCRATTLVASRACRSCFT
jgi:hypothetical protein